MKFKNYEGQFDECIDCASPYLFDYEVAGLPNVCVLHSRCKKCPNFIAVHLLRSNIIHAIVDQNHASRSCSHDDELPHEG